MIEPSVGRIVWYYWHEDAWEQPAVITKVHSPYLVDLYVFRAKSPIEPRVQLVQPGGKPFNGPHCIWPPQTPEMRRYAQTEDTP